MMANSKENDLIAKVLSYVEDALPIHHEQINEVIKCSEGATIDIADNVSTILNKMSNEVDNKANSLDPVIDNIMVSLQFQDRIRQVLEHVQKDLLKITSDIRELNLDRAMSIEEETEILDKSIRKSYSMQSERETYARTLDEEKQLDLITHLKKEAGFEISIEDNLKNSSKEKINKKEMKDDDITFF